MILLTSNGLSSQLLLDYTKKVTKNMKTAVIITTASSYKENDWHITRLTEELHNVGLTVECFDFDKDNCKKLRNYDVIEIIGGNPFYLLKSIHNAKAEVILKNLSSEKMIIGISAGAIVLQNNIRLVASYSPEMNEEVGLTDFKGLNLTELEILPHYHRFINRFDKFEERAVEYEKENNCSVIRIDDGQAVAIYDDKQFEVLL